MLSPGQSVGSFEIVRWLGRGAFADVYEARQVLMHRLVALKVLTGEQRLLEEQLNEARLLASVSHPNIIQIYDCGLYTDPDSGQSWLYLATELAKGGSLRDRIQKAGRLAVVEAVGIAVTICEALACAHGRGIVHRDVKPANVLLTEEGVPKLADFGVGRLLAETQVATTVVGTAPYMAPEAWDGPTHQSDIWSVGVVLYEMLSGAQPFTGRTPAEVELRIRRAPHVPLRELSPEIPPGLEAAVDKALEKRAARRFARAGDFADALRPYCREGEPAALPGIAGGSSETSAPTARPVGWPLSGRTAGPVPRLGRRAAWRWAGYALVGAVLATAAILASVRSVGRRAPHAAPPARGGRVQQIPRGPAAQGPELPPETAQPAAVVFDELAFRYRLHGSAQVAEVPLPSDTPLSLSAQDDYGLRFRTRSEGWVYVFQVDAGGKVTRLFPSPEYKTAGNPVEAGQVHLLPSDDAFFFLDEATGDETVHVICSPEERPEFESAPEGPDAALRLTRQLSDLASTAGEKGTSCISYTFHHKPSDPTEPVHLPGTQ